MGDTWKPCVTPLSGDQLGGREGNQFSGGGELNRKEKEKREKKEKEKKGRKDRKERKERKRKERKRRRKGGGPDALPPFFGVRRTKE